MREGGRGSKKGEGREGEIKIDSERAREMDGQTERGQKARGKRKDIERERGPKTETETETEMVGGWEERL